MKGIKIYLLIFISLFCLGMDGSTVTGKSTQPERFNMSYIFFGSPATYINQVNQTKGSLHVVSPNYFDIDQNGELIVHEWRIDTSFIQEMHRQGIKVVPFLANHWDRDPNPNNPNDKGNFSGRRGLGNRDKLARDIAAEIRKWNLDGVNVDIEGVGRTGTLDGVQRNYRDEHTDLLRLLRASIPMGKKFLLPLLQTPMVGQQAGMVFMIIPVWPSIRTTS